MVSLESIKLTTGTSLSSTRLGHLQGDINKLYLYILEASQGISLFKRCSKTCSDFCKNKKKFEVYNFKNKTKKFNHNFTLNRAP